MQKVASCQHHVILLPAKTAGAKYEGSLSRKPVIMYSSLGREKNLKIVSAEAKYDCWSLQEVKIGEPVFTLWRLSNPNISLI